MESAFWYDRAGHPISAEAWGVLRADFFGYVVVAKTPIGDDAEVSTVWLGLDHGLGEGPPLIFETMIFGGPLADACWRYPNEVAALAGHDQAVAMARESVR